MRLSSVYHLSGFIIDTSIFVNRSRMAERSAVADIFARISEDIRTFIDFAI